MENETQIRLIAFISVFTVMALWEYIAPYRRLRYSKLQRWPHQLTLIIIILLGAPAIGVMIFEIILSGSVLFNHSNISLPKTIEPIVRRLIVTPEMHSIHHSTLPEEHNTNYGFFLSCWDRLFHSYTDQASDNDRTMPIGLEMMREPKDKRIDRILMIPFRQDWSIQHSRVQGNRAWTLCYIACLFFTI